jgi:O-antigen/teichoic acid export membrane protein
MLAAGFNAYLKVVIGMLLGGMILVAIITRLIRIDPIYYHDLRIATAIAVAPLMLMPFSPLRALAEANQRGYAVNLMLIVQSVVITTVAIVLAIRGWGITGQLLAIATGGVVFISLLVIDALMRYRRFLPAHPTRAPAEARRALWKLNTPTLIMNVCGRVGLFSDNIIIGSMLSAAAIVPFLMTQRLAQLAQAQLQSIGSATWAGLAQLHGQEQHELFRVRLIELTRLVVMLGLIVLIPILAYNRAFVTLWVGEAQYAGITLTSIAVANAMMMAVISLWGWAFSGTGRMARLVPVSLVSASLNLAVSLSATWWLSHRDAHRALWGPVIGTSAACLLVLMPVMPMLLWRDFDVSPRKLVGAVAKPILLAIPYGSAVMWIALHHAPAHWATLALHMSLAGFLFSVICWCVLLSPADRANWKLRLRLARGVSTVDTRLGFEVIQ